MRVASEGPLRITRATIEKVWRLHKRDERLVVRDSDTPGLALVVNPTGMTWTYSYRPRGTDPRTGKRWSNRSVTIGNPASHDPDAARLEANRLKGEAKTGGDPAEKRKAMLKAEQTKRAATIDRLVEEYEVALPKRRKMRGDGLPSSGYVSDELAQLRAAIEGMSAKAQPVTELSVVDVRELLNGLSGATARARFGALDRFLDWCLDRRHITLNPCSQISRARRPKAPKPRANFLSPADLASLWEAAADLSEPVWRDLVRFLIAVPCRRGEAAQMTWDQVDLEKAEWRQPGQVTKNDEDHRIFLHPLTIEILEARQKATGGKGLVFPGPKFGKPIDTFSKLKNSLAELSGQSDWSWHDARRSFASALGEAGVPESVADAILNHRQSATRGGVLGVYQKSARWPEQVSATKRWGDLLKLAIDAERNAPRR